MESTRFVGKDNVNLCVSDFTKATGIMAASKGIVTEEGHRPALV